MNYEIVDGDTVSMKNSLYSIGRIYINDTPYFEMVPIQVWEFYIGGYQPAQKSLKGRKGRKLEFDDIFALSKNNCCIKRNR